MSEIENAPTSNLTDQASSPPSGNWFSMFWGNLSLSRKLLMAFGFLAVLILAVTGVSLLGLNSTRTAYEDSLAGGVEVQNVASELDINLLEARRHEKDFLLRWQSEGFETANQNYVIPHHEAVDLIREDITQLSAFGPKIAKSAVKDYSQAQFETDLATLKQQTDIYDAGFNQVVQLVEERGFQDTGLEGEFRNAVHAIENQLGTYQGVETLDVTMLLIRRHEKDYLLRGDQQYIDEVHQSVQDLKDQIEATEQFSASEKTQLVALADEYLLKFDALVAKDKEIAATTETFRGAAHTIEPLAEKFHLLGNQLAAQSAETARASASQTFLASIVFAVAILVVSTFLAIVLARQISRPILQLTSTAQQVEAGDLDARAEISSRDEISSLARSFNIMTSQLQTTLQGLEQRVAERTQNLELAAEVGRAVSQVRELHLMLTDACQLILEEFNLYYVQVYLTDPSQTTLILEAGTGSVGAELLGRGHRLQLDTSSINGRAAVEERAVIISDTTASATFRPNALLPETRGEMSIPLIVGDKVMGVLDMQDRNAGKLTEEVLPAFEALAGQLAVAIQNANLVAEAEQARAEVEAQARRLERTSWSDYLDAVHKPEQLGFVFAQNEVTPLTETESSLAENDGQAVLAPISLAGEQFGSLVVEIEDETRKGNTSELVNIVARQVAQQIENLRLLESTERYRQEAEQAARRQTREGWQEYVSTRKFDNLGFLYDLNKVLPYNNGHGDNESLLTLPLKIRNEEVGKLSVQGLPPDDSESIAFANAVAERLGAHIESLRQYDQARSALTQSERLFEASRRLTQATDLQELVAVTVETLSISAVNRAVLGIFSYDANGEFESMDIKANWWDGTGHEVTAIGTRYPVEVFRTVSLFTSPTPIFFDDALNDPRTDATTLNLAKRINLRAVAVLPLYLGSRQVGVLMLEAEQPHNFSQDEIRLFSALAPQLATILENRDQFERAQKQAERETMLNTINQKIQSATSVEAVLQIAARELGHALGAPMTIAQLSMKDQK